MYTHWQPMCNFKLGKVSKTLKSCLFHSGSLTDFLGNKICKNELKLILDNQSWRLPLMDESLKLGSKFGEKVLLREIFFKCNNKILVYGRSLIPERTLRGSNKILKLLGNESIGKYLFSEKYIYRDKLELARINENNKLFTNFRVKAGNCPDILYARRSIFYIKDKPLLVVEVFNPEALK